MSSNQLKSTDTIVVTGGVGRVKNNLKYIDMQFRENYTSYTAEQALDENKIYYNLEQIAIANQFSTNAPDGEYLFSEFGEEEFQYWNPVAKKYVKDKHVFEGENYADYEAIHTASGIKTRRFRYLNQAKIEGEWYCPKCEALLSNEQVTFEETHQTCGTGVIVKAERQPGTVDEAAYDFFISDSRARCWPKDTMMYVFIAGANWKEQQLTATLQQKEVEIKHLTELKAEHVDVLKYCQAELNAKEVEIAELNASHKKLSDFLAYTQYIIGSNANDIDKLLMISDQIRNNFPQFKTDKI